MRDRERETKMVENKEEFESIRQMHTVLSLHYLEEMKQSEIAVRLNLSTSKVNRLIAQGKRIVRLRPLRFGACGKMRQQPPINP